MIDINFRRLFNSTLHSHGAIQIGLVCLVLLSAAGCGNDRATNARADVVASLSGDADDGFERAVAPMAFQFPRDHGPHPSYRTEWWYYTGNLEDDAGREVGFQFTIFRSALSSEAAARTSHLAANQVYMAHLALTNVDEQRHVAFERYSRGDGNLAGGSGEPAFAVWLEDWTVEEVEPGQFRLSASTQDEGGSQFAVDLMLQETRAPVLHGDEGLSRKGPEAGNASYYYSLIGLETSGQIVWAGNEYDVSGTSWMDHEFGSSVLSRNATGWDWFSVQLDGGLALMFARIRTADGGQITEFTGTLVDADGQTTALPAQDLQLEVLDEWTSPQTGIRYPSGWRAAFPSHDIELEITPKIPQQEMETSFIYWEGAVDVTGTVAGTVVSGEGYVELTGYGQTDDGAQLVR
ncbi:MAG: lipocalin-like domain-containing protein [Caldilineaceae bacterium]